MVWVTSMISPFMFTINIFDDSWVIFHIISIKSALSSTDEDNVFDHLLCLSWLMVNELIPCNALS